MNRLALFVVAFIVTFLVISSIAYGLRERSAPQQQYIAPSGAIGMMRLF